MKRVFLITLLILLVCTAGYFAYDRFGSNQTSNSWDLVPENAAIVYESRSSIDAWNTLLKSELWESFKEIEQFDRLNGSLTLLDSLGGKNGQFSNLLGNGFLVSVHKISNNSFDFLWILDIANRRKQQTALQILNHLESKGGFVSETRKYLDFELQEITNADLGKEFSYLIYDNKLIGSSTSFLVEDVARQINEQGVGFRTKNKDLFELPRLSKDEGNIYINTENISQCLNLFVDKQGDNALSKLKFLSTSMFFDLSIQSDKLLMNGFSLTEKDNFLSIFEGQSPVKSVFKNYIPNRTFTSYEFLFDDASAWYSKLENYWNQHNPTFYSKRAASLEQNDFDINKTIEWLGEGLALVQANSVSGNIDDMLLLISPNDLNEALNRLNTIAENQAVQNGDTVYIEKYSDLEIREFDIEEFPQMLFGPMFEGFKSSYYTSLDGLIIFGNSIEAIKNLVTDVRSESTWGRSVHYDQFIESNLAEFNLSVTIDTDKVWHSLFNKLDPKWKEFSRFNEKNLKNLQLLSTQFSALDENYYSSIAIAHEKNNYGSSDNKFKVEQEVFIGRNIIHKPQIVKNHITNQMEVVLQDSAMNVILISSQGKELWRLPLEEKIVSEISQIDFYKNGKLQMLFATKTKLYIVDRLGNSVENYPVELNSYNIQRTSVLDYDRSKNYRFLISDDKGNLCLMNKEGVLLEGWNPNKMKGRLGGDPFHLRVRGKDVIMAIQENGIINAMNRRGQPLSGFPLETGGRMAGEPFITMGNNFSSTTIRVMSNNGNLTEFNLDGEILNSEQFYRPTTTTKFSLIPDALGKSFVVARKDKNRLVLLNSDKGEILSKDYLSDEIMKIQYYDFSSDNKVYVVTDETQGFSYLYNKDGILVNSQPFDSDFQVAIMYFETKMEYKVYSASGKSLKILSF